MVTTLQSYSTKRGLKSWWNCAGAWGTNPLATVSRASFSPYVCQSIFQYATQVWYLPKVYVRQSQPKIEYPKWCIIQHLFCKTDMEIIFFCSPLLLKGISSTQRQARNLAVLLKQSLPATGSTAGTAARLREAEALPALLRDQGPLWSSSTTSFTVPFTHKN